MRQRRAAQRAEALRLSEAMLEEDAARFDAFLKDNDATVQDAQRRADAETAARQTKVARSSGSESASATARALFLRLRVRARAERLMCGKNDCHESLWCCNLLI